MEKTVKRGYVRWTDENGVFHKEPLANHPDLLASASPQEQLRAEEARRLNAAAEEAAAEVSESEEKDLKDTLAALKAAPEEVHTAAQLVEEEPASAASEPVSEDSALPSDEPIDSEHQAALDELREKTAG